MIKRLFFSLMVFAVISAGVAEAQSRSVVKPGIEVLEALRGEHPIIEKLIEYRMITKLKSWVTVSVIRIVNYYLLIHFAVLGDDYVFGRYGLPFLYFL